MSAPATLQINGTTIDATFAEAFPMKATRLVITAHTPAWAMNAAISDDEVCNCCRGGRLLPVACFANG